MKTGGHRSLSLAGMRFIRQQGDTLSSGRFNQVTLTTLGTCGSVGSVASPSNLSLEEQKEEDSTDESSRSPIITLAVTTICSRIDSQSPHHRSPRTSMTIYQLLDRSDYWAPPKAVCQNQALLELTFNGLLHSIDSV